MAVSQTRERENEEERRGEEGFQKEEKAMKSNPPPLSPLLPFEDFFFSSVLLSSSPSSSSFQALSPSFLLFVFLVVVPSCSSGCLGDRKRVLFLSKVKEGEEEGGMEEKRKAASAGEKEGRKEIYGCVRKWEATASSMIESTDRSTDRPIDLAPLDPSRRRGFNGEKVSRRPCSR